MRNIFLFTASALLLYACNTQTPQTAQSDSTPVSVPLKQSTEVIFKASDGETVYADMLFSDKNKAAPLIILFHQAMSNGRGEYANITPKLIAKGYHVLQVDQRSGGGHYGSDNRTVNARGSNITYCPAYADMEGALEYAKAQKLGGPIFAWGSSYSAALVLKLASEHGDDLAGVLSFSPATGGPMGECNANNFIANVNIPALGIRPESEMGNSDAALKEFGAGYAQKAMYEKQGLEYYIAIDGVHGSSMLDPARAKGDTAPTWKTVWAFLNNHK